MKVLKFATEVRINDGIITAVLSTERQDRDGDIIRAAGWDLTDFHKAPRLLDSHDYGSIENQIGRWENTRVRNDKLIGEPNYYTDSGNPRAIYGDYLARRGDATYSVGFEPKESQPLKGYHGTEYLKQALLECSHVAVPANADALTLMAKAAKARAEALKDPANWQVEDIERLLDAPRTKDGPVQCMVSGCDDMSSAHVGLCADHLKAACYLPPNPTGAMYGRALDELLDANIRELYVISRDVRRHAKAGRVVSGSNLDKLHAVLANAHAMHDGNCSDASCPYNDDSDDDGDSKSARKAVGEGSGADGGFTVNADGSHAAMSGSHSHPHPAFGSQGDDASHSHEHSHDGDASHDHAHSKGVDVAEQKAPMSQADQNDLPDSAFAAVLPGGTKEDGKTVPRSNRLLPHHTASGSLDLPHLRNALARVNQIDAPADVKAAAERHLEAHAKDAGIGEAGESDSKSPSSIEAAAEEVVRKALEAFR